MKKRLLLLLVLTSIYLQAQTTYTYTGTGDWANTANWSPSYPGTTIVAGDTVIINGNIVEADIINAGHLTISSSGSITTGINSGISNTGTLINEGVLIATEFGGFSAFISTSGTLSNTGTITIGFGSSIDVTGSLINTGVIEIQPVANLYFSQNATIENSGTGIINNNGSFNTAATFTNMATINNVAALTNNGSFTNAQLLNISGTFTNNGTFVNVQTIENTGTFINNDQKTATNNGTFNNTNSVTNNGIFVNPLTLNNTGTFVNNATLENTSLFNNTGTLTIAAAGTMLNLGTYTNEGTIENNGTITNNGTLNNPLLFTNNGNYTNNNIFNNTGTLNCNGVYTNTVAFSNVGIINIETQGTLTISETIDNQATGSITNSGTVTINALGTLNNFGTINNTNATFTNAGTVVNNTNANFEVTDNTPMHLFRNQATFTNHGTLTLTLASSSSNTNTGTINNTGVFDIPNDSYFPNQGTIANHGVFTINSVLFNDGVFLNTNEFNGSYEGSGSFANEGITTGHIVIRDFGLLTNTGTIITKRISMYFDSQTFTNEGIVKIYGGETGFRFSRKIVNNNIIEILPDGIAGMANDTFINNGTILNKGTLSTIAFGFPVLSTLHNSETGVIDNRATLVIDVSDNGMPSTLINDGAIINTGTYTNNGALVNNGTITNSNALNNGGSIAIEAMGTLSTSGTTSNQSTGSITNAGTITTLELGTFTNAGTITMGTTGTLSTSGTASNQATGSITNSGTVTTLALGTLNNFGTLNNTNATFTNAGTVVNNTNANFEVTDNTSMHLFRNQATFTNHGTLTLTLASSSSNTNTGTINNTGVFNIPFSFPNQGTIANHGVFTINNTLINDGVFLNTNEFNGSYEGSGSFANEGITTGHIVIRDFGLLTNTGTIITKRISMYFDSQTFTNEGIVKIYGGETGFRFSRKIVNNNIIEILPDGIAGMSNDTFINNGTILNKGTLSTIAFGSPVLSTLYNSETGVIDNRATLVIDVSDNGMPSTLINDGAIINTGTYTNNGALVNNGAFTNNNIFDNSGILNNTGTLNNIGVLSGNNTSHTEDFTNAGTLSPGNSPGTYTFNNNYLAQTTASLQIELENATTFDIVTVNGTAAIDGTLEVTLLNNYLPVVGDSFTFLTGNTLTGTFTNTLLPTLTNNRSWTIDYTPTSVALTVIANPPTIVIPNDDTVGPNNDDILVPENNTVNGDFSLITTEGLASLQINTTIITKAELLASATTPIAVNGTYGVLTITNFNDTSGLVSYNYDPTGTAQDLTNGTNNILGESFSLLLTDSFNPTTANATLNIGITESSATAFNFDGIDDYAVATNPSILDITTGTIEMRIKPQTKTTKQTILCYRSSNGGSTKYLFNLLENLSGIGFWNGSSYLTIPFAFNEDQWYNITVSDDDSGFTRLYIDGEFMGNFASEFGTATGSNLNLYIGIDFPGSEYFKGDIGDIRIWNTVKEQGTASCMPSASGADLLAYYNFNQAVDSADNFAITTVTDQTNNANDIQLTNVALTGTTSNWLNTDNVIFDTDLPLVFTQDITVSLTCSVPVTILPEDVDNFSGDNCGIASLSLDIDTFDGSMVGVNTVTLSVTDLSGNVASQTAQVTVVDYNQTRLYVNALATGNNDGTDWANAYNDLQKAITFASNCTDIQDIWVAAGTYKPSVHPREVSDYGIVSPGIKLNTFHLVDGVALYGGFSGNETAVSERNLELNKTILSGAIGSSSTQDNSNIVVMSLNDNANTVLDGFHIKDGISLGFFNGTTNDINTIHDVVIENTTLSYDTGCGLVLINSNLTTRNCIISNNENRHVGNGTGISIQGTSNATFTNILLEANVGHFTGGIFKNTSSGTVIVNNATITNTQTAYGIENTGASLEINNSVTFNNNLGDILGSITGVNNFFNVATDPFINSADADGADNILGTPDDGLMPLETGVLVDAGNTSLNTTTTDITGNIRNLGANIDVGAYEFQSKLVVAPKVFLQGALLGTTNGLMRDDLRVANLLPTTSPYTDGLTCNASVFNTGGTATTGLPEDDIVDWIWLELRDENDNTQIITATSALLQRDGDIVSIDGVSSIDFLIPYKNHYVTLKHRNHLGVMTMNTIALNGTATPINFTDATTPITFGTDAQTTFGMPINTFGMWAGDANGDGRLNYLGAASEIPSIRSQVFNDPNNSVFSGPPIGTFPSEGYHLTDINMDGNTVFSGVTTDVLNIRDNVFNNPSNSVFSGPPIGTYLFVQQLPEGAN